MAQTGVTTTKPTQGDGSSENPFIISSAKELAWFRDWVNGTYMPEEGESASKHADACAKISDDVDEIDMNTVCSESIGRWVPIGYNDAGVPGWSGSFDGNNKVINNLYINDHYDDGNYHHKMCEGLFCIIEGKEHSFIRDIYFKNINLYVTNSIYCGALVGSATGYTISGIHILNGNINSDAMSVAGIVDYVESCKVSNCTNMTNITGTGTVTYCSGIINWAINSMIEKCTNQGDIKTRGEGAGLINDAEKCTIKNCANIGNVEAGYDAAGLVTFSEGSTIENCTNIGNIKGTEAGGILLEADTYNDGFKTILKNVFTLGNVEASRSGALVVNEASRIQTLGYVIYNTDATLTISDTNNANKAFSDAFYTTPFDGSQAYGMNMELIKSGYATYLLQQGAEQQGIWGQQIGIDVYPQLASSYNVYADNVNIECTGAISQGKFTNTKPTSTTGVTIHHGTTYFHQAVPHTCFRHGKVAYYECSACHKLYSGSNPTQFLFQSTDVSEGHQYQDGECAICHQEIPTIEEGIHTCSVKTTPNDITPGCYNLYKFIATSNGSININTVEEDGLFCTIWNDDLTQQVTENKCEDFIYNGNAQRANLEKGKTYYIGLRRVRGDKWQWQVKIVFYSSTDNITVGTIDGEELLANKQDDTYLIDNLNITDGQQLALIRNNVQLQSGSYTRTFSNDNWQPLYVPFELEVTDELLADFDLAAPNNLHEYELADGNTKVVLEAKKMKSGNTIKALRPYLIRAKEAGEKTIQLSNCPLKTSNEDTYVSSSSVLRLYKFIGTLKGKTSFDPTADFVLSGGIFYPADVDAQLKPMRWYLNAIDSDTDMGINSGSSEGETFSRSIDISIIDGDPTTGIDDIHVITEQATGSLSAGFRRGIYDLQGRKLTKEPKSGIYIKDGKKMVK